MKEQIYKLAKKGLTPPQIGVILSDACVLRSASDRLTALTPDLGSLFCVIGPLHRAVDMPDVSLALRISTTDSTIAFSEGSCAQKAPPMGGGPTAPRTAPSRFRRDPGAEVMLVTQHKTWYLEEDFQHSGRLSGIENTIPESPEILRVPRSPVEFTSLELPETPYHVYLSLRTHLAVQKSKSPTHPQPH
ncbi:hypothetical protein GH733_017183 [Mirounga leonina]|nr:hypothetical protein GH733_017183 [Mirounga leonina]